MKNHPSPTVVVIDDDPFICDAWQSLLAGTPCRTYLEPDSLLADLSSSIVDFSNTRFVITDFYFPRWGEQEVLTFFSTVRSQIHCPLILASDASFQEKPLHIDHIIEKLPLSLEELQAMNLKRKAQP